MASEQIGRDSNKQPKPNDEKKYCESIEQEISIGEAFLKVEHSDLRLPITVLDRQLRSTVFNP